MSPRPTSDTICAPASVEIFIELPIVDPILAPISCSASVSIELGAPGDRLLAYAGEELRGVIPVTDNPTGNGDLFFLSVAGLGNERISFALERDGQVIAETAPMMRYVSNAVSGSTDEPMVIDFLNGISISVSPNPFHGELDFAVNAKAAERVEFYLHSADGATIYRHAETVVDHGVVEHCLTGLEPLAPGCYIATVVINDNRYTYKLIKQ